MPLQRCSTCKTQFNVPDVTDFVQVNTGRLISSITFANQMTKCIHCLQDYLIVMQLSNAGRIQFGLVPVAPPNGVAAPPPSTILIAKA